MFYFINMTILFDMATLTLHKQFNDTHLPEHKNYSHAGHINNHKHTYLPSIFCRTTNSGSCNLVLFPLSSVVLLSE